MGVVGRWCRDDSREGAVTTLRDDRQWLRPWQRACRDDSGCGDAVAGDGGRVQRKRRSREMSKHNTRHERAIDEQRTQGRTQQRTSKRVTGNEQRTCAHPRNAHTVRTTARTGARRQPRVYKRYMRNNHACRSQRHRVAHSETRAVQVHATARGPVCTRDDRKKGSLGSGHTDAHSSGAHTSRTQTHMRVAHACPTARAQHRNIRPTLHRRR